MKKRVLAVTLASLMGATAVAQETEQAVDKGTLTVGMKIGLSVPKMRYSSASYDNYERMAYPGAVGGLTADYRFWKGLSVKTEMLFVGRGVKMDYAPRTLHYSLRATYFDWRFPITYTFMHDKMIRPYVGVGPSFNYISRGHIEYIEIESDSYYRLDKLTKGSIKGADIGMYFGGGCGVAVPIGSIKMLFGLEIGYNLGLVDTFTDLEQANSADAVNTYLYDVEGTRKNGNLEIAFTAGIPLDFGKPREKKVKEEPVVEKVKEEPKEEPKKGITIEMKTCYSIDEMLAFVTLGQDISDKKVCAFEDLQFDFGKATIRKESEEFLNTLYKMMKAFPKMRLSINGHTDNIGGDEHNMKLSKQRAQAVADYLTGKGIAPYRMECEGYGATYPLESNDTEEGRARNRRVEIDIQNIK